MLTKNLFNNDNTTGMTTELNALSRTFGRSDIRTQFRGTGAYTDGKTIVNLPEMPVGSKLTADEQMVLRGFHIHEVSHIRHTQFRIWKREIDAMPDESKHMFKDIWNAIEDVHIERKAIDEFAGAKRNLEATVESVFAEALESSRRQRDSENYHWAMEVPMLLCGLGRLENGYMSKSLRAYCNSVPSEAYGVVGSFIPAVASAANTKATHKIAVSVMEVLKQKLNEEKQQQEQEQQQQQQQSQDEQESGEESSGQEQGGEQEDSGQAGTGDSSEQADESKEQVGDTEGEQEEQDGGDSSGESSRVAGNQGSMLDVDEFVGRSLYEDVAKAVNNIASRKRDEASYEDRREWEALGIYLRSGSRGVASCDELLGGKLKRKRRR